MGFGDWLIKKGLYESTIKKHLVRLKVLDREIEVWNIENIDQFIINLRKTNRKNVTLNSYIDTIRLYSQYNNLSDELQNYKHYRIQQSIKGTLSDKEIEDIISLPCPKRDDLVMWNKYSLLFELLAYTGCRPQEICTLKQYQIDWGKNVFNIEHTKTGIPRFVPIPPNLTDKIKNYIKTIDTEFLFITTKGMVFSYKSYLHNFNKRKEILGITRPNITPYSFRHSYATSMLEADVNIHKLAKLLGHSIKQTAHYEHLTTKDICSAILKHPLIRKNANPDDIIKDIKEYVEGYQLEKYDNIKCTLMYTNHELTIKIRPN